MGMAGTKNRSFGNIVGHAPGVSNMTSLSEWTHDQFDQSLDWSSIDWIKSKWDRKLILKGINDVEDARIAADIGADAIIVSNHGGRQLDGAAAPIDMLARIVDAVGDRIEVHMDSGIRTGQDVFKAIAVGAKSTYIGRAYIYGLGAMGQAGVSKAIEIVHSELDKTMALCGETDIHDVGRHNLLDFEPQRTNHPEMCAMSGLVMPPLDDGILSRRAEVVAALRAIVPGEGVVAEDTGMRVFESDGLTAYRQLPLVVVLPETVQQVADVMRYCGENGIKVVPRGSGTSLSGGALAGG